MELANNDVRKRAKENGVKLWRIADVLGIAEATFTRKLRHELPEETKETIYRIIDELRDGNGNNGSY